MARHNLGKKIDANGTINDLGNTVSDEDLSQIDTIKDRAFKEEGVYFVDGTGNTTAGTWEGTNNRITSYYDGLTINFKVGVAGDDITTLNINGLGAKNCYLRGTTKITTHYAVGTMVILSYNATTDAFYSSDYDANSYAYVRQYGNVTTNSEFPMLFSKSATVPSTYTANYASSQAGFTYNPSTKTLTSPNIKGTTIYEDGTSLANKYLSKDGGTLNYQGQIKAGTSVFKDLEITSENFRIPYPEDENTNATKIATFDLAGYLKYRTANELRTDMGLDVKSAAFKGVASTIDDNASNNDLTTSKAVRDYVESKGFANPDDLPNIYMKVENPKGTGSFSLNRAENTTVAAYSVAIGENTKATSRAAHAVGVGTTASGQYSHAEGAYAEASGYVSHAEGIWTKATNDYTHAEGSSSEANGGASHAEGLSTIADGDASHTEGYGTHATHLAQHVFGAFNVLDTSTADKSSQGTYIEIVGNGNKVLSTGAITRSNARTLDWSGNEVLAGTLTTGGNIYEGGVALSSKYTTNKKGTCSTAAATQTKIVESNGFILEFGTTIDVTFTYALSVASPSLNVNSTGIKPIKYMKSNGSLTNPSATTSVSQGGWAAGQTVKFMYNGTNWIEILNISTGAYYGQSYYAQSATSATKANNIVTERNYTTTNTFYPVFSNSNAQGVSTPACVDTNLAYVPSTGVLSLSARPQVNGVDVALSTDTPDIPNNLVQTEDYSQSSDVSNTLTNYVTKNELLNLTHPINSIYISINSTSPSQLFGGTWVELPAGTALWTTATASGDAGGTIAAGLPNITGTWTTAWNQANRGFHSLSTSGAFYDSYSAGLHDGAGRIQGTDENNSGTRGFPWFDASRSNSIYGNSNTVQPPAYKIYAWRRTA